MFFWPWRASFIDSKKASTTRAQSFLEIIGPAVREIWAVTLSTRSALVIRIASCQAPEGPGMLTELSAVNCCVSRAWATCTGPRTDPVEEFVERRAGIVRTGRGLRMVLHREDGFLAMTQAFDR